jgi:AraC family transcriptional regulator
VLISTAPLLARLQPGRIAWAGGASSFAAAGAGEGGFKYETLSIGVFLKPLPSHRVRHAGGREKAIPLAEGHGWIFPVGFEGWCAWDEDNAFVAVEVERGLLDAAAEDGLAKAAGIAPVHGALDPATAALALQLHAAGPDAPKLYRDSLTVALAAQALSAPLAAMAADALDPRLRRALDLMEAKLAEDVSLAELAAAAAMSPFHFARVFRAALGRPPHQELIARRIDRAKALLRSTSLPVADVAYQCGWQDGSKFIAAFRKHVGVTPGAFRIG